MVPPKPTSTGASLKKRVDPKNPDDVSDFLVQVRKQVEGVKTGPATWALVRVEEDE